MAVTTETPTETWMGYSDQAGAALATTRPPSTTYMAAPVITWPPASAATSTVTTGQVWPHR